MLETSRARSSASSSASSSSSRLPRNKTHRTRIVMFGTRHALLEHRLKRLFVLAGWPSWLRSRRCLHGCSATREAKSASPLNGSAGPLISDRLAEEPEAFAPIPTLGCFIGRCSKLKESVASALRRYKYSRDFSINCRCDGFRVSISRRA